MGALSILDAEHLRNMRKLETLILYGTPVTEAGFIHLKGLNNLEEIRVLFGLTDRGLRLVSDMPSLKEITIDGDTVTAKGLAELSKMKSLEHVYVDNTEKMDVMISRLPDLPRLKGLTIGTGLTDKGIRI